LAPAEHADFLRSTTSNNPLAGLAALLASPIYAAGKQAYFNPVSRAALQTALPTSLSAPLYSLLQQQVGQSRTRNSDPLGQMGGAAQGFALGLRDLLRQGK